MEPSTITEIRPDQRITVHLQEQTAVGRGVVLLDSHWVPEQLMVRFGDL